MVVQSYKPHMNSDVRAEPARAYCFSSFSDIICVQIALIYIWMDSKLKGISIESKNKRIEVRTRNLWSSKVGDLI